MQSQHTTSRRGPAGDVTRAESPPLSTCVENKAAQASASWLTGGSSQCQIMPRAARSFSQPRPISHLGGWPPIGHRFDIVVDLLHVGDAPPPRVLLLGPLPRDLRRGSIRRCHRVSGSIRRAAWLVGHPEARVWPLPLLQAAAARDQPREAARAAQQPAVDAVLVNIASAERRAFGLGCSLGLHRVASAAARRARRRLGRKPLDEFAVLSGLFVLDDLVYTLVLLCRPARARATNAESALQTETPRQ